MVVALFSNARALRAGLVMLAMLLAVLLGVSVPNVTYAAPPMQSSPTGAADLAQAVSMLVDLLIAFAVGGGVAYVLQMSSRWTKWRSPFKPVIVLAITAGIGASLSALKVAATMELFAQAPDWARAFIGFIVVFVGSQLTYQKGFSPQWAARVGIIAVLLLGGALMLVNAPIASAESPASARLAQEPQLACVAIQAGVPSEWVALKKIAFDTEYGIANHIETDTQWAATFGTRMQFFTARYGLSNVADEEGKPLKWCARLIAAQRMFAP